MQSNDSAWLLQRFMLYGAYLSEGLLIGGANLLVAIALLRYEALRSCNRFKFIIAQSAADFINMLAYAICGSYRLGLLYQGTYGLKVPLWDCALSPHRILWGLWGDRLVALTQLLVACDRLLSVALPLEYIGWGAIYPTTLITASSSFITLLGLLGYYLAWGEADRMISNRCSSDLIKATGEVYSWYYQTTSQIYSILTLPIYGAVVVLYRRQMTSLTSQVSSVQAEQLKQQRRFTKSLVINCVANMFLWLLPFSLAHLSRRYGWGGTSFGSFNFIVSNIYPLCDVIIFSARHREVRQGITGLVGCKTMPSDLRQWAANESAKSQQLFSKRNKTNPITSTIRKPPQQQQDLRVEEM